MESYNSTIIKRIILIVFTILICIGIYFIAISVYKKEKATESAQNVITDEKIYDQTEYPKVDASLPMQNLSTAFFKNFTASEEIDEKTLNYTNNHNAYLKLINDEVDLIIAEEPSQEELALARSKGIEFEMLPIAKEAFVFFINSENRVDNLSIEELQKIYTGEIRNWREVGGSDEEIIAYQNPKNSTSQNTMQSLVMKNLILMDAPSINVSDSSYEINNLVSTYNNERNAIGYSSYTMVKRLFSTLNNVISSKIKLLKVNNIEPNVQTIIDKSYPFETNYYIVLNDSDESNSASRELAKNMLSARGKAILENAGYIPAK